MLGKIRMFKSVTNFLNASIVKPIKEHPTLVLFFLGTTLIFFGAREGDSIDSVQNIPVGTGATILKAGGAILGAGVFAAVMKSAQFTEIFKQHVHEVFYDPENAIGLDDLKHKWTRLTESLLAISLPQSHRDATAGIMNQFFDEELEYHFENLSITIDAELLPDKETLRIRQQTVTDVIVSPNHVLPVLEQTITVDSGDCELTALLINHENVDELDAALVDNIDAKGEKKFSIPLHKYATGTNDNGDKVANLERVYEITQNITLEPFVLATIARYVKGFTLRVKCTNCNIHFKTTGLGCRGSTMSTPDGCGYDIWKLADKGELLLPGQGYILILTA